uniref:Prisilkin-39-like n=1 Tax=Drosophila rhopaloa TaxID=1041015 RepID=A0A6P4E532_DRORH
WFLFGLYAVLIAATVGQPLQQNESGKNEDSERGERVSRQIPYPYMGGYVGGYGGYGGYGGIGGYGGYGSYAAIRSSLYPYGNLYGSSGLGLPGGYYGRPYGYGGGYNIGYPAIGGVGGIAGGIFGVSPLSPFA